MHFPISIPPTSSNSSNETAVEYNRAGETVKITGLHPNSRQNDKSSYWPWAVLIFVFVGVGAGALYYFLSYSNASSSVSPPTATLPTTAVNIFTPSGVTNGSQLSFREPGVQHVRAKRSPRKRKQPRDDDPDKDKKRRDGKDVEGENENDNGGGDKIDKGTVGKVLGAGGKEVGNYGRGKVYGEWWIVCSQPAANRSLLSRTIRLLLRPSVRPKSLRSSWLGVGRIVGVQLPRLIICFSDRHLWEFVRNRITGGTGQVLHLYPQAHGQEFEQRHCRVQPRRGGREDHCTEEPDRDVERAHY